MPVDRVVFSHNDAVIKVYNESGGVQGSLITSDWMYVQNLQVTESVPSTRHKRLYAGYDRPSILPGTAKLSFDCFHSSKVANWNVASTRGQFYWFEIEFFDDYIDPAVYNFYNRNWENIAENWEDCKIIFGYTYNQLETWTLKHCSNINRDLKTSDINTITREFNVGEIA